jgi:NADH-quinone oxidoreductase subunit J
MLFTYLLLTIIILALALAPTLFNNPVRSVISFIAVFLLVAGILLSINIEFLAFVYAIVYIGAVAVLFLFIVMLLKVSTKYHPAFHSS